MRPESGYKLSMTNSQISMSKLGIAFALMLFLLLPSCLISAETEVAREPGLRERLVSYLSSHNIPREFIVAAVSTLPIVELRGAIPVGIATLRLSWWSAYGWAVLGNLIPVVPLLLFLGAISRSLSRVKGFSRIFGSLFERTKRRSKLVERYESLGLMLFVAIPLPVTGAWTGSIAALIFGISFRRALLFISLGVLIAGFVVTLLSLFGLWGIRLLLQPPSTP